MNNEINNNPNQNLTIDAEKLKMLSGVIKKTINDLKTAKKNADDAWDKCNASLGTGITVDINERKQMINKEFDKAIAELETDAETLESVANIWNDTEVEIMTSSKSLDDIFIDLNKTLSTFFGPGKKS